jgi:predicted phosphodiesterase
VKIAAISDIHGNLPALEAVLADIATEGVDVIVNLGDIVCGPLWVAQTAERLMALKLPTIRGNHERQVLTIAPGRLGQSDAFAAQRLEPHQREWLRSLPETLQLGDAVFCCHGTPTSDLQYFLETVVPGFAGPGAPGVRAATLAEASERAGAAMLGVPHAVILCGHTHVPRVLRLADGRLIVNPGSVGLQAYDDVHPHPHVIENGSPHARYALLSRRTHGWQVDLRAVPYDHEAAARLAQVNARPDWADALRTGFVGRWEAAPAPVPSAP